MLPFAQSIGNNNPQLFAGVPHAFQIENELVAISPIATRRATNAIFIG